MLYKVNSLTTEKLEQLYIHETYKLTVGINRRLEYNLVHSIKRDLTIIDAELTQRGLLPFSEN